METSNQILYKAYLKLSENHYHNNLKINLRDYFSDQLLEQLNKFEQKKALKEIINHEEEIQK